MSTKSKNKEKKRASGRKARVKTDTMKIIGTNSGQINTYTNLTFAKLSQLQGKF